MAEKTSFGDLKLSNEQLGGLVKLLAEGKLQNLLLGQQPEAGGNGAETSTESSNTNRGTAPIEETDHEENIESPQSDKIQLLDESVKTVTARQLLEKAKQHQKANSAQLTFRVS